MHWILTKNNQSIELKDIPIVDINNLRNESINQYKNGKRIVSFFGNKENEKIRLYIILADDANATLMVSSCLFNNSDKYFSFTSEIPAFHIFEREFYEDFEIEPLEHPWLKPLRHNMDEYKFFEMKGEQIHHVAVGPIHAGIIEPGHFRFMCNSEKVYHLEIQLGYQHRDIENLFIASNDNFNIHLAESIAGDTTIGHATAYANAMEALNKLVITERSQIIRAIALEIERVAVHTGDLAAISNDIAYLMGNSVLSATRTLIINLLLSICGNRFGKNLICTGGVNFDISNTLAEKIIKTFNKVGRDITRLSNTMFSTPSVLSRLEKTGILDSDTAKKVGIVGFAARASDINTDTRTDHPWGWYKKMNLKKETLTNGDVYARSYLRYIEITQSLKIINELLNILKKTDSTITVSFDNDLHKQSLVVSMLEGWRGEIVHTAITDSNGKLMKYKIKDPSFNNWYGLALAVRNNNIADFPLCNKSFNLSYCGNDL